MIYQVVFTKQSKTQRWGCPGRVAYSANKLFTLFDLKWMEAPGMWWPHLNGGEPSVCSFLSWSNSLTSWHSKVSVGVQPQGRRHWRVACKIKPFSKLYKILLAIIMWLFVRMLLHTNLDTASFLRFSSKTKSRVMKSWGATPPQLYLESIVDYFIIFLCCQFYCAAENCPAIGNFWKVKLCLPIS